MIPDPVVTDRDRERYPFHTDDSIRGILIVKTMSYGELKATVSEPAFHGMVCSLVGKGTNPFWVTGRVLEELLLRGFITNIEFNFYEQQSKILPLEGRSLAMEG